MKILFSPSEAKNTINTGKTFNQNSFIFPNLYKERKNILISYNDYIANASQEDLSKIFGTKKQDIINYYTNNIFKQNTSKVINRYSGVAFDYLNYSSLKEEETKYVDNNVLIFSNLFGPILAGDTGIPDYKLKQGEKINNLNIEKFYNENFSKALNNFLKDDDILDLRAGFYEKFYKINKPYMSMKFIKNGKVVSHWAKAYRGIILNLLAINNIKSFNELINLQIDNLSIIEIKEQKIKKEIVYKITS